MRASVPRRTAPSNSRCGGRRLRADAERVIVRRRRDRRKERLSMGRVSRSFLLLGFLTVGAGCAAVRPLPDQASMDAPQDPTQVIVVPEWPTAGKRYLVERDGQQEIRLVKDNMGTIEFIGSATQQTKFWIKLGRCLSFSYLQGPGASPHDFGQWASPRFTLCHQTARSGMDALGPRPTPCKCHGSLTRAITAHSERRRLREHPSDGLLRVTPPWRLPAPVCAAGIMRRGI